jgi:NAD(P)H dehydrogenase (quinone)
MPKVLVLFQTRTGRTAAIAEAIARGAETVKFTEVEIRRIEDLASDPATAVVESEAVRAALAKKYRALESIETLSQYDALIIGSPARYGAMSPEIKRLLDQAEPLSRRGALSDKVGSAFGSVDASEGGGTTHVDAMHIALIHLGLIIVPPADGGSSALAGDPLAVAQQQGARVAKVAEWVRHAKSHEAHGHHH